MARFYRPRGHHEPPVLWNPATNMPLYEFVMGMCETEEPLVIELLRSLGFSEEPISPNVQQAMDIAADLTKEPAPPPPAYSTVPAEEPPAPKKVVAPAAPKPRGRK